MATIAATATALPAHPLPQSAVSQMLKDVFGLDDDQLPAIMAIYENAGVQTRYTALPVSELLRPRSLDRINREYAEAAVDLGERVAADALARAGVSAGEVDFLITVSCTGIMIPSLDAHLINRMGLRADVRRLPITELGCAAGASALARAADYLRGAPGGKVLVVAVELPSLTFQRRDLSPANLISCALFGDGAAAALVTGDAGGGPRIVDTASYLFPDSLSAMGFELKDTGLHIVLSKEVPDLVRARIKPLVGGFLGRNGVDAEALAAFVLHPGGKKILKYMEAELGLKDGDTAHSWGVLRDCGNMSSASILFVLDRQLAGPKPAPGSHGLMAGFGPGFSAELLLLRWGEAAA